MNTRTRTLLIAAATVLGWLAMIVDVLPWGPDMTPDLARLALVTAGCGSCVLAIRSKTRPALEVYETGYQAGRLQGKIDAAVDDARVVVPIRRRVSS